MEASDTCWPEFWVRLTSNAGLLLEFLERGCAHCAVLASSPQREPCVPHPRRGGGFHDQQPCVRPGWVAGGGGGGNGGIKHN